MLHNVSLSSWSGLKQYFNLILTGHKVRKNLTAQQKIDCEMLLALFGHIFSHIELEGHSLRADLHQDQMT